VAIIYLDTFHAIGQSTDTKPLSSTEGMEFLEVDTQKIYVFYAGQWRGVLAGSGSWSPSFAEALTNKTIVLNSNIVKTTSGTKGLFSFDEDGEFAFVPIGSAGLFLKVNASGTGFEFADPATTGAWNPVGTETITNKTLVVESNTLKGSTPALGSLLLDNGTKYLPLAKGANNSYLGVNNSGVVGWYATSGLGGGGGSSPSSGLARPSQTGYKEGWYDGGIPSDHEKAHGLLDGEIQTTTTNAPILTHSQTRGKYLRFPCFTSGDSERIRVDNLIFRRNYFSYHLLKFRISQNVPFNFFTGFDSDTDDNMDNIADVNDSVDAFMIAKLDGNANFQVASNGGTSNATVLPLTSNPFNTDPHTIEIQADPTNNRFQYRIDDFGGTWNNVTTNIPRTDIPLGLVTSVYTKTNTDFDFEMYLLEAANKVML
jgi:hypothetical protein